MREAITIVTHAGEPDGVEDDHLLAVALARAGATVRYAPWTDLSVDWSACPLTVVRSTWDYHLHPVEWFQWLHRVTPLTKFVNAPALLRWNSDKGYLLELATRGVPVVPTARLLTPSDLPAVCSAGEWDDVVVKPAIGASSYGARRFRAGEIMSQGIDHARALTAKGAALVQPYQSAVEDALERSLVYVDGGFCHAFSKPAFYGGTGDLELRRHVASDGERRLAELTLAALPVRAMVARIDMIPGADGPLLMEGEFIEPQLALHLCDSTADRFARALIAMIAMIAMIADSVGEG